MPFSKWDYVWPSFERLLAAIDPDMEDGLLGLKRAFQTGWLDSGSSRELSMPPSTL
jgi:hypothetical protein